MRNVLCGFALAVWLAGSSGFVGTQRVEVPSRFTADQVYVTLQTKNGGRFELYTDSGGGALILSKGVVTRLGLASSPVKEPEIRAQLGQDAREAMAPPLVSGEPPLPPQAFAVEAPRQMPAFPVQGDGVVGAAWFAGGIWTWDYPGHHLVKEAQNWAPPRTAHVIPLGFRTESDGTRSTNFARIPITVDGQVLQMLLDTGAETYLRPAVVEDLHDGLPALRATSFMRAAIFDGWRNTHPDWRVIENAEVETGTAMILVPSVEIAGLRTGPVWFTRKPDANYMKFMSSMMDKPVDGSVGGDAFHAFVLTIDYPGSRAALVKR